MTRAVHDRIWEAVRNVGAANMACAAVGDVSSLRHTIRLISDAADSLESLADEDLEPEVQLSIARDARTLRARAAELEQRVEAMS